MANNKDFIVKNAVEVGGPVTATVGTITSNDIDLSTGNYFSDTLAANTTYTFSNAGDVQSFQLEVTGGATVSGYELGYTSYDSKSFDTSTQSTSHTGIFVRPNGGDMYLVSDADFQGRVNQYTLSTPNDVSTASHTQQEVIATETNPESIFLKPDGTKMYIGGQVEGVRQYSLSTAWDLSTYSYDSKKLNTLTQDGTPAGLYFKSDGTKFFVFGRSNNTVFQYSMSTAWDVSTGSYDSKSFSASTQDTSITGGYFNDDGTKMFIIGNTNDTIFQYTLSTAWDVSTASYDSVSFDVTTQTTTNVQGITFNENGEKLFVFDSGGTEVYQYSPTTSTPLTLTWPTSIEWTGGEAPSAPPSGQKDILSFITTDGGTSYLGTRVAANLS